MDAKALEEAISQVRMDASNLKLTYEDGQSVKQFLDAAAQRLADSKNAPDMAQEHFRSGFASLGKARGILGRSSVQSSSFRRHQWPYLPPEADPLK